MNDFLLIGGTGSLGRSIAKRLLSVDKPQSRIIIFSRGEHAQESAFRELSHFDKDGRLRFRIGDVRDLRRVEMAMRGVDCVIHAAAMKVVPKCETDPFEAVRTNIEGAQHVIEAAINCGVKRVVAISTDKCVSASTLYGATKACAERLFSSAHVYTGERDIRFASVRYGNVSNSQGSVIPLWRSILDRGETRLPVTSPFCTRYWITLDEAVDLILWTIENMRGGEVVVPDMPAYQVSTLVEAMGGTPNIIGLRKSEKLHEDIVSEHEFQDFKRCGPYWVKGNHYIDGYPLIAPMRSDCARRMSIDELRERIGALKEAA